MHITIITSEFAPFVEKSSLSEEVVLFARALKRTGHVATVLMPFSNTIDIARHSLARRLMPIRTTINGAPFACHRFDGRTPDGVDVFFLDIDGAKEKPEAVPENTLFYHAVCSILPTLASPVEACIAVGAETAGFANVVGQRDELAHLPVVAALSTLDEHTEEAVVRDLESTDRIVLSQGRLYAATLTENLLPLKEMLSKGHILWLPVPAGDPQAPTDKPSAKAAFQMAHGLPVRPDIPLVLFAGGDESTLATFLTGDVQVAADAQLEGMSALKERYPDRMACEPSGDLFAALDAFDACVCDRKRGRMIQAMLSGVVPVVSKTVEAEAVDLENTLASGSAIVMPDLSPAHLAAGLERLLSAFHRTEDFRALLARLPSYACTFETAVSRIIDPLKEIITEKKRDGQTE